MRTGVAQAAALLLVVGLLLPAAAQSVLNGGVSPQKIKLQVVDTSHAIQPLNLQQSFRPPRAPTTFSLNKVFPKITVAPWPPKMTPLSKVPIISSFFPKSKVTQSPIKLQQTFPQMPQQ